MGNASKVKMSGSEKIIIIKANMNTGTKILGKHIYNNSSIKIMSN